MRMRAAEEISDSSNTPSPVHQASPPTSSPHQYQRGGGDSPVLTELLPSRPMMSSESTQSGAKLPGVAMFAMSPTGTPRLPETYRDSADGCSLDSSAGVLSTSYSAHQLSYQGHSYQYQYEAGHDEGGYGAGHEEGDYGRSVSDSESGYHTPGSSPYSHTHTYSDPSPPHTLPNTAGVRTDAATAWCSPPGITTATTTYQISKDSFVPQEHDTDANRSLHTQYHTDTPCYLPSTVAGHYSQKQNDRLELHYNQKENAKLEFHYSGKDSERLQFEDSMSAGHQTNENEIYGAEDRQQILDSLLARKSPRVSESENTSPVPGHHNSKKNQGHKKRRRRTQTPVQRSAANMRERKRMCHLNVAFDHLKDHLPNVRNNKKLSRIQTLRAAIYYISLLTDCMDMP